MRVADPRLAQQSVMGLYSATMSAIVAVKLHNGRLFALGSSVGEHIDRAAQKYVVPSLVLHASKDAAVWIPLCTSLLARGTGVVVCAPIQHRLGIVATAMRGAHMIFDGAQEIAQASSGGLPGANLLAAELVIGAIMVSGISFQMTVATPAALKLLLAPLLALEWGLTTVVTIV